MILLGILVLSLLYVVYPVLSVNSHPNPEIYNNNNNSPPIFKTNLAAVSKESLTFHHADGHINVRLGNHLSANEGELGGVL